MRTMFKGLVIAVAMATAYGFGFGAHASPCEAYQGALVDLANAINQDSESLEVIGKMLDETIRLRIEHPAALKACAESWDSDALQDDEVE